jgi:hypothetical protein
VPLDVRLDAGLTLTGRALAPSGAAAPSTIVALYRLERSERPNEKETTPRRIRIAEAIADAEGMFRFESMAAEPHEIVAFHPALGRSDRSLNGGAEAIEIRLKPFARAVGVVVRNGAAAKGVRVQYVPDLAEFQSSRDPADLRGGDTVTDREGRFSLAVPARGRGEIRVGDEASGIRRIALAPAETRPPVIDLGRIVLDDRPVATLVLEGSDGCEIVLIGPAGRAGMSIVKATRIGPAVFEAAVPESGHWQLAAICGTRERAVLPTMVFIGGTTDRTIRLTWPQ